MGFLAHSVAVVGRERERELIKMHSSSEIGLTDLCDNMSHIPSSLLQRKRSPIFFLHMFRANLLFGQAPTCLRNFPSRHAYLTGDWHKVLWSIMPLLHFHYLWVPTTHPYLLQLSFALWDGANFLNYFLLPTIWSYYASLVSKATFE